ncbi:3343_t:CDS:2 [Ambispora leptoticha]|uniref:3343_t:CDS:1 n=1 Tax=Ambispora leptoticha TaxID=144679 RepID=A0A9N9GQI8_9GLOM|nr:3343_t:CDS:2 [Ambispora leptoticha]
MADAFTDVAKRLFTFHVYPTQAIVKETFKAYIEEMFPDFMSNIGQITLQTLLQKIKNNRGAALQSVRSAVWCIFRHKKLPLLKSNVAAAAIVSTLWVYTIARTAFSAMAVPTLTNTHCVFKLAQEFKGNGLLHDTANAILTDASPQYDPDLDETLPQRSSSMHLSQEEMDDLSSSMHLSQEEMDDLFDFTL